MQHELVGKPKGKIKARMFNYVAVMFQLLPIFTNENLHLYHTMPQRKMVLASYWQNAKDT